MTRALRLLVGAVIALILVGFLAQGIQYVYLRYAKSAESDLLGLLEYLFTPKKTPPAPRPLSEVEKAACARGVPPSDFLPSSLETVVRNLYSIKLCELGELPLSRPDDGLARVRLLRVPRFGAGRVVRLEHSQVGNRMFVIKFRGKSHDNEEAEVTNAQWERMEELLDQVSFWELPSHSGFGSGEMAVLLEVSEPDRYHVVSQREEHKLEPIIRYLDELSE